MKVSKPGLSVASDLFLISKGTYLPKLQEPRNTHVSKQVISSVIAAIYDPSGLINSVVQKFPD
jgi:hypothetical protein